MIEHNFQFDHIIITHWHRDHIGGVNNVLDMITNKNGNILLLIIINMHVFYFFFFSFEFNLILK